MTTNRMGLEQEDDYGLSAQLEVLEALTAPGDTENQQLICLLLELKRRRATAILDEAERAELLAYRKASSEPVADVVAWNKPGEERKCDIRWRRFDVAPGPLFAAPPLQAVTVPDGWQLVPTELTDVMRDAWDSAPNGEDNDLNMQNAYRAMIAAVPKLTNEP